MLVLCRGNGAENGNYYIIIGYILGLYWDNGEENGNFYIIIGYILDLHRGDGEENGNYYIFVPHILHNLLSAGLQHPLAVGL